jgi:hypothetical protein
MKKIIFFLFFFVIIGLNSCDKKDDFWVFYHISISCSPGGTTDQTGSVWINSKARVRINFIPDSGYRVDSIWVDKVKKIISENYYEFGGVKENHQLHIFFGKKE